MSSQRVRCPPSACWRDENISLKALWFLLLFIKWWHSVSTVRSAGTPFTSDCLLPALPCAWVHWTRKLATKQFVSKSCDLLNVGDVATDGVSSQKFRHWPAETRANRLLVSGKPGHVKSSDRSAAKKTDDGYQSQWCSCWITSGLTVCANDRFCFTLLWVKIIIHHHHWVNSCVIVKLSVISGIVIFMQIGKEYLNALACKFYIFF